MPFRIFFLLLSNHFDGGGGTGVEKSGQICLASALVESQLAAILDQTLNGNCDVNNVGLFFEVEIWKLRETIGDAA